MFGYVKGAFTGAKKEGKMGIFEMAHKGTVFLDEIGELELSIQAKLLRVLQEKEVCRLGDDKIIPVDIRHLFNVIERILALTETDWILPEDLIGILPNTASRKERKPGEIQNESLLLSKSVADCEKERIEETLKKHKGSRALTAEELNISTATLWKKMKKYQIL